ncbi:MAG: hypothetical protein JXB35_10600 [Anaerolineae bacterium]|nr:hypothetical protein [Anaerolineae bacterium]
MEKRETFVLNLVYDPQHSADLRGHLRHIASNREVIFHDLPELIDLLHGLMTIERLDNRTRQAIVE